MEKQTVKFEAGKTYYYRFIGDSDLVVKCKVTKRTAKTIAYNSIRKEAQRRAIEEAWIRRGAYRQNDDRADALQMLRRLLTENCGNYTKVPMMGHTHLYFCSPVYGHADYNKVRTCNIEGNEIFCKKVIDLGERILAKKSA